MKYFNRKSVSFCMLATLLAVSVFLNWKYDNSSVKEAKVLGKATYVNNEVAVDEGKDTFENMKLERDSAREESLKSLKEMINNPNASDGAKADAENSVFFINQSRIQEIDCETILKNKNIGNVMVCINENGVNVFVETKELHPNEIAIITETVKSHTPFSENMIKISTSD